MNHREPFNPSRERFERVQNISTLFSMGAIAPETEFLCTRKAVTDECPQMRFVQMYFEGGGGKKSCKGASYIYVQEEQRQNRYSVPRLNC